VRLSSARLFPLLLMLTLALLTFWLERLTQEEPVPAAPRRHDPDFIIEGFTLTEFGADGKPVTTLSAARMTHFPDDGSTDLLAPRAVQTRPGEPRLRLAADRGTLTQDGNELLLYDNVMLARDNAAGAEESRLRSNFLHFVSARALVRTDREVEYSAPGRSLRGRGMEYDNTTGQLLLHAQVRGTYEARLP
jgi:lipopolysaccharide export system protein LptC